MKLDEKDAVLIDGGLGANNPFEKAWESIEQLDRGSAKTVDIDVSIGTSRAVNPTSQKTPKRGFLKIKSLVSSLAVWVTDTYPCHENMDQRS